MRDQQSAVCSFCGESRPRHDLAEGVGEVAARICLDCALACSRALKTEQRLEQARESQRPAAHPAPGAQHGAIVEWTPFSMDGRELEWRAERAVVTSRAPVTSVSVRRADRERGITVLLDGEAEATLAHAVQATAWLAEGATPPDSDDTDVRDWAPFEVDGARFEWRAGRGPAIRARTAVIVSVRDPATGDTSAVQLSGDTLPTVEDAVMAASCSSTLVTRAEEVDEMDDGPGA